MKASQAISRFNQHAIKQQLFGVGDRILLAVSGGRDSMCMLALFEQTDQPIGVAHMNFQLRGEESDRDARFVESYCLDHGIEFHLEQVDCREYMSVHGLGLQEAARDLRYAWMASLRAEQGYQAIATAHHQDDNVETLLINLMRGTGVRGLTGIPVKRSAIVRPMMCFDSLEIQSIVDDQEIIFCLDSSNDKDDYLRNLIRHHLIPLMNEIKPGSSQNIIRDIKRIKGQWEAMEAISEPALKDLADLLDESGGSIQLDKLKSFPSAEYILVRIVAQYGFTVQQCSSILQSDKSAGIGVQSSSHEMILDRDMIRIDRVEATPFTAVRINIGETKICHNSRLEINRIPRPQRFRTDPNIEYLAVDSLPDGGEVRAWASGDRFSPFGMRGSQKVSDLLTNLKYSTFQKRNVKVLVAGDQIVWVIGLRLSDHYKVDPGAKEVLQLTWTP